MLSCEHVLKVLEENKDTINRLGVKRLGIFGSIANNSSHDDSDLDFLVDFEAKSFDAYMDLKIFLEDLFNRHVDLVIADNIKPRLRSAILKEAVYAQGL